MDDPLLAYLKAAEYVGLSLRQFRRVYIATGILPIVRVSVRRPRVRQSDLDACLKLRTAEIGTRPTR